MDPVIALATDDDDDKGPSAVIQKGDDPTNFIAVEPSKDYEGDNVRKQKEAQMMDDLTAARGEVAKLREDNSTGKLMAIPGVRQAIDAFRNGEQVDGPPAVAEPPREPPVEPDWESLSEDPRAMSQHIIAQMGDVVANAIGDKLKPMQESISGLQAYAQAREKSVVTDQIDVARKKYKDFSALEPAMLEVHQSSPGLSVDELYIIARQRAGASMTPQTGLDSERPSATVATSPSRRTERKPVAPLSQHQEFEHALATAADTGYDAARALTGAG